MENVNIFHMKANKNKMIDDRLLGKKEKDNIIAKFKILITLT